jgi:hypothetical protein
MRIALICADLRPERDAVGDYARRLAAGLQAQGCETLLLGLQGRGAFEEPGCRQFAESVAWPERLAAARLALADFAPDEVGLQFAPHAWEPRGMPIRRARDLGQMLHPYPRLLTLHELWECPVPPCTWQGRLRGQFQRPILLRLARGFGRDGVIVTNTTYRRLLAKCGVTAKVLPLFGNVPPQPCDRMQVRAGLLAALDPLADWTGDPDAALLAGVFGSLNEGVDWPDAWRRLRDLGRRHGRRVAVLLLGGGAGEVDPRAWQAAAPEIAFRAFGRLPGEELSPFLSALDLGLTPYRVPLLGKSGSAAALFEHGTPVLSLTGGGGAHDAGLPARFERLLFPGWASLDKALAAGRLPRGEPGSIRDQVARDYLALAAARAA